MTPEDVAVQRRLRYQTRLSPKDYEAFLAAFGHPSAEQLRRRPLFRGKPFEL